MARVKGFALRGLLKSVKESGGLLIEGWLEGLGEALGAAGMACRQVRCVHQGDAICEFEGSWKADRPGRWLG